MSRKDCVRHPSLEDPLPSHLSKDSKEKKGGCPEAKEVPALCLGFLICRVGMVMNPARRITGRMKWVNSCKALKAGDARMVSTQSILARMFVSIHHDSRRHLAKGVEKPSSALGLRSQTQLHPGIQQGWR